MRPVKCGMELFIRIPNFQNFEDLCHNYKSGEVLQIVDEIPIPLVN